MSTQFLRWIFELGFPWKPGLFPGFSGFFTTLVAWHLTVARTGAGCPTTRIRHSRCQHNFWPRCSSERSYNPLSWTCCDFSPKLALYPWKLEISSIRTQKRLIEDNWGHSEDTWGHSEDTWGHLRSLEVTWGHLRSLKETQRIFWGTFRVFHHVLDYFIIY